MITTVLQLSAITKTFRLAKRRKTTAAAIDPRERGRTQRALKEFDLPKNGKVRGVLKSIQNHIYPPDLSNSKILINYISVTNLKKNADNV